MGLDAFVRCNCLAEGKFKKPPVAEDSLYLYDDLGLLAFRRPPGMPDAEYDQTAIDLDVWAMDCCEHKNMRACSERVANWANLRTFRQYMEKIGTDFFPTLLEEILYENVGYTEASCAPAALAELDFFTERAHSFTNVFFVDVAENRKIYPYTEAYGGEFRWSGDDGFTMGFDDHGFFVKDGHSGEIPFRSMRFRQCIRKTLIGRKPIITLIDIKSGQKFSLPSPILGCALEPVEVEFAVLELPLEPDDIPPVEPLRRLFRASIATGNPVFWC